MLTNLSEMSTINFLKSEKPTTITSKTSVSSHEELPKLFIPYESKPSASASKASPSRKTPFQDQHSKWVPFLNLIKTEKKPVQTSLKINKLGFQVTQYYGTSLSLFPPIQPICLKDKQLSEEEKLFELVRSEDCQKFFKNTAKELKNLGKIIKIKKKIIKFGATQKIAEFWTKQSLQCPIIFKRIGLEEINTQNMLVEVLDLIKVQGQNF